MYNDQAKKSENPTDGNNQRGEISEYTQYDHELNQDTKNIIYNCQEIITNIQLDLPIQTIDNLYQEGIYIEMFKKMFPFMKDKIDYIEDSNSPTGEKLQQLINGLSTDVLTMDLTHIKGQAIADKDPRHLINFLQIILELSKLYSMKQDPEQNNGENCNLNNPHSSLHQNIFFDKLQIDEDVMVQKILQKQQFICIKILKKKQRIFYQITTLNNKFLILFFISKYNSHYTMTLTQTKLKVRLEFPKNRMRFHCCLLKYEVNNYAGEDHEEGIYNDQNDIENEDPNLQQNNMVDSYKNQNIPQPLTKKKSQKNLIQEEKKKIESNIYSHQNQRVITNAPNIKKMVPNQYRDPQEQEQEDAYVQNALSEEQQQDTAKIQELFNLYKSGAIAEEDPKLQELHFLLQKHGLTLEEIMKHGEGSGEVYENNQDNNTLSQVISISRNRLDKMRNPINYNVDPTNQQIYQGQQKYQTYLKNYKREYEKKMKKKLSAPNIEEKKEYKRKRLSEHEDKMLKQEYRDEQLSLYYQMRDKKVQYLRNIHKIIFELEKKKIIDEQNEYKESKQKLEDEAKNKLISIENKYKDRILMLKDALDQQRRDRHVAEVAQRQELSKQERELKQIKRKQIEDLKDLWRSEREKFDLITKDDRKLESEILELYKKY